MSVVINYKNEVINYEDNSPKLAKILADKKIVTEIIPIEIFGDYANYSCTENTKKVDGEWVFDEASVIAMIDAQNNTPLALKLKGVAFDGIMCSATKDDAFGLTDVKDYIEGGASTEFKFANGNKLLLTTDNISNFFAVWRPFRQSFFTD